MCIKKNILWCILILLLLFPSLSFSQVNKIGFRIEPFLFLTKTEGTGTLSMSNKNEVNCYLTSINFSYKYNMSTKLALSTRVGYLWSNEERYKGLEINELLHMQISDKAYLLAGINIHFNNDKFKSEVHSNNFAVPSLIMGAALKLSDMLSTELQYQFGAQNEYDTNYSYGTIHHKLSGVVKLSFGFEWDFL